ncbi:MAG: hypothetical protein NTU88_14940, partial [Armatimonadetes bacterium]|nr:hypothetical protein [Armatimonadota bacterium]
MNDRKAFPWVNVWMLVFSIGGIWLIGNALLHTHFEGAGDSIEYWLALAVLLGIALAALWRMPMPFSEETEGPEPTLPTRGRLYLHSWRMLLRMRWLLIFFGAIALVGVADAVADYAIFGHRLAREVMRTERPPLAVSGPASLPDYVLTELPLDLARRIPGSPARLFPHLPMRTGQGGLITPLAVLALMVWLNRRLKRLAGDPRLSGTALLCRIMLIPTAAVAITVPFATCLARMAMLAYAVDLSGHKPPMLVTTAFWTWSILSSVFIMPFLLGGFTGSLRRSSEDKQVSGDAFVEDAVRYAKPFIGFLLALSVVESIFALPVMLIRPGRMPAWFLAYNDTCMLVDS